MKCKTNKPKHTCGTKTKATCVFYDLDVPNYSNLKDENCLTLEETISDLYSLITSIKQSIDLTDYDKKCLDIDSTIDPYTEDSTFLLKDTITELTNRFCSAESNPELQNIKFILENLDYKTLVLPCDTKPKNLFQFFQMIINKITDE